MVTKTPLDPFKRGAYMRSLIDAAGVSQREAARMLHVNDRTLRRWLEHPGSAGYVAPPWAAVEAFKRMTARASTPGRN